MSVVFWLVAFVTSLVGLFAVESAVATLQTAAAAIVAGALLLRSVALWALEES
ncbi:hypothetical protein WMF38_56955 [Sorangium sp. So ce118]